MPSADDATLRRHVINDTSPIVRSAFFRSPGAIGIFLQSGGRIVEFEVMIRPDSGLKALVEEMGRRLAAAMPRPG